MAMARRVDVVIIGAGAAGLAAAHELARAGLRLVVLEARDRIGGRILTVRASDAPAPLELGAEFLHGAAAETMRIVSAARLELATLPYDHLVSRGGRFHSTADFWGVVEATGRDIARLLRRRKGKDLTFREYLDRSKLSPERRQMLCDFAEGYHAAHTDLLSAATLAAGDGEADDADDDAQHRVVGGYDSVLRWLRDGLVPEQVALRLGTVATEIRWKKGEAVVACRSAAGAEVAPFRARAAVVTVPHAVLKAKQIAFRPAVPAVERAVQRLEPGQVFKIVMRFRESFWDQPDFVKRRMAKGAGEAAPLNFVHAHQEEVPTWWTTQPHRIPVLTGWAGGPRAESLLNDDEPRQVERSLASLARALAVPRRLLDELLEGWAMHDWRADPFSRAAYTYARVGGLAAQKALARPVSGTLVFAGEATSADETGTVSGALASGRRAARQLKGVMGDG